MKRRREEDNDRWQEKEKHDRVAIEATAAWRRGDYKQVCKLYKSILPILTELETKRLDYAKRHYGGRKLVKWFLGLFVENVEDVE